MDSPSYLAFGTCRSPRWPCGSSPSIGLGHDSADARLPIADPHALDCDVVVAAQAQLAGSDYDTVIVATTNARHLAQFVPAMHWSTITSVTTS